MEEKTGCVRRAMQARRAVHQILDAAGQLAAYPNEDISRLAAAIIQAARSLEE